MNQRWQYALIFPTLALLVACAPESPIPQNHSQKESKQKVAPSYSLEHLQGAWWADDDPDTPTAAFSISGDEVWLDFDAKYHPCRIEGSILVFDIRPTDDPIKNEILSLSGDKLALRAANGKIRHLTRAKH